MNFGRYSLDEYACLAESFHGNAGPGLLIGGMMVDKALRRLPEGELYDAICETTYCLPDAVQLLTPCTIGNGWLKIIDLGRLALSMYEKYSGHGVRVFLDPRKLEGSAEVMTWFLKLKPKREQYSELLREQILEGGADLLTLRDIRVRPEFMAKRSKGEVALCPLCGECYPTADGEICKACRGGSPYLEPDDQRQERHEAPGFLKKVPVENALGQPLLHDMTMIIPETSKGPVFRGGEVITADDLCRLRQMGRQHVYQEERGFSKADWVHENEAALAFAGAMAGDGIVFTEPPSEGKCNMLATRDGLLLVDEHRLEMFNMAPGVMCASRHNTSLVRQGEMIAGTRAVPLYLPRADFQSAMRILHDDPLFRVIPLRRASIGTLVTGNEISDGLIEDKFGPIIEAKAEQLGCRVVQTLIVPDEREAISRGVKRLVECGADVLVTTAGLSVDPDDVTRQGLIDAGATDVIYGAPILPGAMTLVARIGKVRILGVPACALYFKTTAFDLLLPRVLAELDITRSDLAKLGHGAFCLGCEECAFPACPFGR